MILCPNCRIQYNHGRCDNCGSTHRLKRFDLRKLPRRWKKGLQIIGDDVKSEIGSTILHSKKSTCEQAGFSLR